MDLTFERDEEKNARNIRLRGISFEEAKTVFRDPLSITLYDRLHSGNEERFIDIGLSDRRRLLVVVYTERGTTLRIISCRKAEPPEQKQYEQHEG